MVHANDSYKHGAYFEKGTYYTFDTTNVWFPATKVTYLNIKDSAILRDSIILVYRDTLIKHDSTVVVYDSNLVQELQIFLSRIKKLKSDHL